MAVQRPIPFNWNALSILLRVLALVCAIILLIGALAHTEIPPGNLVWAAGAAVLFIASTLTP